ncbi:hypothetical protein Salat_1460400 [Sesamum alatum]|uniref:Uncharacterized protein n=1 Tax=Sesamum alatum TaxID=300844 RepID=A0AAE1YBS7_9LAMI|nr:hypothetical protein Salat_1460400 [Sesamum alatum]
MNGRTLNCICALRGTLSPHVLAEFKGTEGSKDTEVEPSHREGDEEPSKSKKRKRKHKNKSKKSKSCSSDKAQKKALKDTDEVEGFKMLQEIQNWWKSNREELHTPSQWVAEMVGEKCIPDWAISDQSSTLRTHVGQDSWEMFKAILCGCDQALLDRQSHTKVEEHVNRCIMQACAFSHNLSLKCFTFREDKKALVSTNTTLKSEVEALKV